MSSHLYETFLRRLHDGVPFAFSRWGDGEWGCLLGHNGTTCDGQPYTVGLQEDLTRVLTAQPKYDLGIQSFAMRRFGVEIQKWIKQRHLNLSWVNADVFAHASLDGSLRLLVAALRTREVIFAGPHRLSDLHQIIPLRHHAFVPLTDAHGVRREILSDIGQAMLSLRNPVVMVSAGPTANLLVHDLYSLGLNGTVLDIGSVWEPYLGWTTRSYHTKVNRSALCV